ncbi:MAG: recombinase family protein [Actinobacteria bacterium]|nr:recombinase family protein [Actinomycetota bacterium]
MLEKGTSLEEIAEGLNDRGIRKPHGQAAWSATIVRKAVDSIRSEVPFAEPA